MKHQILSTKVHGAIDYAVGTLLTSTPFFAEDSPESAILATQGITATTYSLFTDYELAVARKIPVKTHLALDIVSGAFLVAAPWLFNLDKKSRIPFVALGLFEITTALLTKPEPED